VPGSDTPFEVRYAASDYWIIVGHQ